MEKIIFSLQDIDNTEITTQSDRLNLVMNTNFTRRINNVAIPSFVVGEWTYLDFETGKVRIIRWRKPA